MKFQAVKGMRDAYPDDMRVRTWLFDAWRRVSLRNGFEEYDAPLMEYLDLFTVKSGDEIAEQLFHLTDRGGRNLALRPEITPSLARMVAEKLNSLPRPIKWFSLPRLFRAERPQRGRLREFFQWNVDVIGEASELADAECVFVLVDFLQEVGFGPDEIAVRYSSRALLAEVLGALDVAEAAQPAVMAAMDKRGKIPPETFEKLLTDALPDEAARAGVLRFLEIEDVPAASPEALGERVGMALPAGAAAALEVLDRFRRHLEHFGIATWCRYDPNIVRGLAYYTGIVYEAIAQGERAVAGGGRYDNLLELVGAGGEAPATGFGMGDVVLGLLLAEKGKLPDTQARLDYFVIAAADGVRDQLLKVVGALRRAGHSADYPFAKRALGKQLKEANRRGARAAVLVREDRVGVKDLASGDQEDMPLAEFLARAQRGRV